MLAWFTGVAGAVLALLIASVILVPQNQALGDRTGGDASQTSTNCKGCTSKSADAPFILEYYGLLESFGVEWERPTPWWLYAGIAAGVLLVAIFLLGLWKRRLLART